MITISNLKYILTAIGFEKSQVGDYYERAFTGCNMAVDFDNEQLIYPESKGLKVNDKTTSNFSHPENFVVFECVCRLLDKGYRPEHIELEPRWQLGHDGKSGKADILVRDENGQALIIIECKTAGTEYNKEKKNTEADGGQLFSYWQQENAARWLALYASDWKDNDIVVSSHVINGNDDANILKLADKDTELKVYRKAHNNQERYEVWSETYGKQWIDNLLFDAESRAYNIGIPPLRKGKLRNFTPEDKIVNRFEEILRHNNVSDKENAFNRLVALFICKLVDEIKKQDFDEVEFQYKQGTDTYESLQDRLQRLHKQGMEEFMREKIFYVGEDYAERFIQQCTGENRQEAIEDLKQTIRILKFYSNNDFAFKDVHNEELFFQNGKILVEVVELFQPYRIVYTEKNQFLGDLFEQLLNKGFKQNEGQFFTPMPITRFIWDSLPLQTYISEHGLPNIIDYACGAGHFLTEGVEAVNKVRQSEENSWVEKHVFGVEKDYRLARVSKISMFMNGAGGANIIFGDGLENYPDKHVEDRAFDILVANPPYSVSGFKQHLRLKNNTFNLLPCLTNDASEIETLFVERIAQLLKPQGLAAVVLPASILSNSSTSYTAAREQLLQNFQLRAVVSFGGKTFGATGTNTVTLFMERYNEPPRVAALVNDSVNAILSGQRLTQTADRELLADYLSHQQVSEDDYRCFIREEMDSEQLAEHAYFKVYYDVFKTKTVKIPKKATAEEEERLRREAFYKFTLDIERGKLYYFALVRGQQTFVVTAPTDNKEQEQFLGYKWSNRKGAEGLVMLSKGGQLYNDADRFARGTLAAGIRNAFVGASTSLPDEISKYANTYRTRDMIDFSRCEFDKAVNVVGKKKVLTIKSKFQLTVLGDIATIQKGKTITSSQRKDGDIKVVAGGRSFAYYHNEANRPANVITISASGAYAGFVNFWREPIFASDCNTILANEGIDILYLYNYLVSIQDYIYTLQKGAAQPHVYANDIAGIQIPLPPLTIQQQIVRECEAIDEEYNTSRMTIETYRQKIADVFDRLEIVDKSKSGGVIQIGKVCVAINPSKSEVAKVNGDTLVSFIEMASVSDNGYIERKEDRKLSDVRKGSYTYFAEGDIILAKITPCMENGKCALAEGLLNGIGFGSSEFHVLRPDTEKVNAQFLFATINRESVRQEAAKHMTGSSGHRRVPITFYENMSIPNIPLAEQQSIMAEVATYEAEITKATEIMQSCEARKKAILESYLN